MPPEHSHHSAATAPDHKKLLDGATIETLAKAASALALLSYAVGVVTVNTYLLGLGSSDFSLLKPRFVLVGFVALTILSVNVFLPICAVAAVMGSGPTIGERTASLGVALVLLAAPFGLLCWLTESWSASAATYFASLVFGLLVLFVVVNLRYRADAPQGAASAPWWAREILIRPDSRNLNRWAALGPVQLFVLGYLVFVVVAYSQHVFPKIPDDVGGARPRTVTLALDRSAADALKRAGLVTRGGSDADYVELLFQGDDFFLFRQNGRTYQVATAKVIGTYVGSRSPTATHR